MALFKILKGLSQRLGANDNSTKNVIDGYAYFTPDDGKFYIDVLEEGGDPTPYIGNHVGEEIQTPDGEVHKANRICINQRIFTYNDYDTLDCGTASAPADDIPTMIFNCGTSAE